MRHPFPLWFPPTGYRTTSYIARACDVMCEFLGSDYCCARLWRTTGRKCTVIRSIIAALRSTVGRTFRFTSLIAPSTYGPERKPLHITPLALPCSHCTLLHSDPPFTSVLELTSSSSALHLPHTPVHLHSHTTVAHRPLFSTLHQCLPGPAIRIDIAKAHLHRSAPVARHARLKVT